MIKEERALLKLQREIDQLEKCIPDDDGEATVFNGELRPLYQERTRLKKALAREKSKHNVSITLFTKHPQLKRFSQYVPNEGVIQN